MRREVKINKHKKKIVIGISGVLMALVVLCLCFASNVLEVSARDTLKGIKEIVKKNSVQNQFVVLELVPDDASYTIEEKDSHGDVVRTIDVLQSMGTIGYYVDGQEPTSLSENLLQFDSTQLRKDYVQKVQTALAPIMTNEGLVDKPLAFANYEEIYEGTLSEEDWAAKMAESGWKQINYDNPETVSDSSLLHADQISGYKMEEALADGTPSGNFIRYYMPEKVDLSGNAIDNPGMGFYDSTNTLFEKSAGLTGGFDPYVLDRGSNTTDPAYFATFAKTKAKIGYRAVTDSAKRVPADENVKLAGSGFKKGMPVYSVLDGEYIYKGTVDTNVDGNIIIAYSTLEPGLTTASPLNGGNKPTGLKREGIGIISEGETGKRAEGEVFSVSKDSVKEVESQGIEEELPQKASETYYTVSFVYVDSATENENIYQMIGLTKAAEGTCIVNKEQPFVPNAAKHGMIEAAAGTGDMVYRYVKGSGTYVCTASAGTDVVAVSGIQIYCRGGYTNNKWFKQFVFDRDLGAECDNMYVEVRVRTPRSLTTDDLGAADFVHISNPNKTFLPYGADSSFTAYGKMKTVSVSGGSATQTVSNDIPSSMMTTLLYCAREKHVPFMVDYSLLTDSDVDVAGSNVCKIAKILQIADLDSFYLEHSADDLSSLSINEVLMTKNNNDYVNRNIYFYNMVDGLSLASPLNIDFTLSFSEAYISAGFDEVLAEIKKENFFRESDAGQPLLPESINEAVAIKYIINYTGRRVNESKSSVKVLELEPCYAFNLSSRSISNNIYALEYTNNGVTSEIMRKTGGEIQNPVQMSTAEFIGKIEDINNEYDVIYIGDNVTRYNRNATTGETEYNDTNMNGLVYTSVGDYIYTEPSVMGMLSTDYNSSGQVRGAADYSASIGRMRYSGNDITADKKDALIEFVRAGYPVVFEDRFFVKGTDGSYSISANYIDNQSNMYAFATYALTKLNTGKNVFLKSEIDDSVTFEMYLNLKKPTLEWDTPSTEDRVELLPDNGAYFMSYRFKIHNESAADTDAKFDCKLYVDINSDGKFSPVTEVLGNLTIADENGNTVAYNSGYSLSPDIWYTVSRTITDEYVGIIPWKLEVTQNGNNTRRASKQGYYYIDKLKKEPVRILQITTSDINNSSLNMQRVLEEKKSVFGECMRRLETEYPFDLQITTITSGEYLTRYQNNNKYLDNFDMLVLGFSDCYVETQNEAAIVAIKNFILNGKSVLFSHDTTSFINAPFGRKLSDYTGNNFNDNVTTWGNNVVYQGATYWGYFINKQIRDTVGMDRYGVTVDNTRTIHAPKSTTGINQIQGYSYPALNRMKLTYYNSGSQIVKGYNFKKDNYVGIERSGMGYEELTVNQVNKGQITQYPYKLKTDFVVNATHGQYYQLDLESDDDGLAGEGDGETDVVVWYTLGAGRDAVDNAYSISKYDVRNNYFIYNKGNITYTGQGHRSYGTWDAANNYSGYDYWDGTEASYEEKSNEAKLFVNTIIAAYDAGVKSPAVSFVENRSFGAGEMESVNVSSDRNFETASGNGLLDSRIEMYFEIEDTNIIQGADVEKLATGKVFLEAPSIGSTVPINGVQVHALQLGQPMISVTYLEGGVEKEADLSKLEMDTVYKLTVPTAFLNSNYVGNKLNSVAIHVEATRTFNKLGNTHTLTGSSKINLVRSELFDLD